MNFKNYFRELKRRNVFKAALAYLVVSWVVVQVSAIVFPTFNAPPVILRTLIIVLVIGFPVWLVFAWIYEVTPEGLRRTENISAQESIAEQTSSKMNKLILAALGIAIILLCIDLFGGLEGDEEEVKSTEVIPKASGIKETELVEEEKAEEQKSVAVLAFEDMSPEQDQEYFADGISEEILNSLAKSPDLTVMSRTSSFYFKGKEATVQEIGEKLNVNYILEGSIRKAGDNLRITAQLINVSTGAHLWSQNYDRKLKDIFKIQDEIADKVSSKLQASLLNRTLSEIDPELYTLYLKARHVFRQNTESSALRALEILEKVISEDPDYAPVWALKSEVHFGRSTLSGRDEETRMYHIEKGGEAASKAIEIDPEYAMGYFSRAIYLFMKGDYQQAKYYAEKALELSPDNPQILRRIDIYTFPSPEDAIVNIKRSFRLNPLLYEIYFDLANVYYYAGNFRQALEAVQKYEGHFPNATGHLWLKAEVHMSLGHFEAALKDINSMEDPFWRSYSMIEYLYHTGRREKAKQELEEFRKSYPEEPANIADIYASLGKKEKTFEWLRKAVEMEDPTMGVYVYIPSFKKYHSDPRWQEILRDIGVPKENGIPGYKKNQ